MGFLADRVLKVPPSATMETAKIAASYKRDKITHYHWGLGEPDMGLPEHLCEAGKRAFDEGKTKYTPSDGALRFKEAIREFFLRFDLDYKTSNITAGHGSKGVLFNALFATLNPGDEVIVPAPYWVSYPAMITLAGGTMVEVQPGDDFKISSEGLENAITPQTKWFIFNDPSNPSGAVYTHAEKKALGDVLERHEHVMIMTDDMYWAFNYTSIPYASFAAVNPKLFHRTFTTNGPAKSHMTTGLRIGFGGAPDTGEFRELVGAMGGVIQGNIAGNPNTIAQEVTIEAILGDQSWLPPLIDRFRRRRDAMVEGLTMAGLSCDPPEGAFYVMPRVDHLYGLQTERGVLLGDDVAVAKFFAEQARVIGVPGSAFGLPGTVRFAYPVGIKTSIVPGAKALKAALETLHR